MSKTLKDDFIQYMSDRYGAKGRRSIRYCSRTDELDILLGIKDAPDFDDKDKKFLNSAQMEELKKLSNNAIRARKDMEKDVGVLQAKYI